MLTQRSTLPGPTLVPVKLIEPAYGPGAWPLGAVTVNVNRVPVVVIVRVVDSDGDTATQVVGTRAPCAALFPFVHLLLPAAVTANPVSVGSGPLDELFVAVLVKVN